MRKKNPPTVATTEPDINVSDVNPDRAQVAAVGNPRTVAEVAYVEVATAGLLVPSNAPDPVPAELNRLRVAEPHLFRAWEACAQRLAVTETVIAEQSARIADLEQQLAALDAESQVSAQVIMALESRTVTAADHVAGYLAVTSGKVHAARWHGNLLHDIRDRDTIIGQVAAMDGALYQPVVTSGTSNIGGPPLPLAEARAWVERRCGWTVVP